MGRRLDNSDRGALISVESARRIQRTLQKIEAGGRSIPAPPIPTAFDDGDPVRICKTAAAWDKGTTATLNVWEKGSVTAPEQNDPAEELSATNLSYDVAEGSYVIVARAANGEWYLVEAASPEDEGCQSAPSIAGHDLTGIEGYDATKTQVLGHESGCLKWINTTTCVAPPGGGE